MKHRLKDIYLLLQYKKRVILRDYQLVKQRRRLVANGVDIQLPFEKFDDNFLNFTPPIYIGPYSSLYLRAPLTIGKGTIIGPHLTIHTANHRYEGRALPYDDIYEAQEVRIGENVWIGSNVTILPGVTINDGAIVGANAVVTRNVDKGAVVVGNPAKVVKFRDMHRYEHNMSLGQIYLKMKAEGLTELNESKRTIYVDNK